MTPLQQQGALCKAAGRTLATAGTTRKNEALSAIAEILSERQDEWLAANAADVAAAKEAGMIPSMLDRLTLTPQRVADIVSAVRQVIALPDPVGRVDRMETRPNVTVDAAVLCLKSGNACILRGGKEAIRSNRCVAELMRKALASVGLPEDCVYLISDTSHETATELMHLDGYVDVLIPRGGAGLIRAVAKEASVPVIRTGEGVCHIYVDDEADLDMAAEILYNAKCSRPSVCNAVECVLVHQAIAEEFWRRALPLLDRHHVELRADEAALRLLGSRAVLAATSDWDAEYDDYILAVRTVNGMEEAVSFINDHGTGHSEAIMTTNYFRAQRFLDAVDAAAVYVNASTRFTDGGEFGLGAEIGISTQKMHARGPMGLEELTSCKYVVYGEGQVR